MTTDARTSTPTIVAAALVATLVVLAVVFTPVGGWMFDTILTVLTAVPMWIVNAALTLWDAAVSIWHWIF